MLSYMIGSGYIVSWCVGHLAGLADAAVYDPSYAKWHWADLPIIPETWRFTLDKTKTEQFAILQKLMRQEEVTEVINACDAGREGELIFRTVYHLTGCTLPMKRLWISSMEDAAIREGFANLRPGSDFDGLYHSALCRAKADWLVGINATRLFSVMYRHSEDAFIVLVQKSETERIQKAERLEALLTEMKKTEEETSAIHSWAAIIRKYLDLQKLDRAIVEELIDHIEIGERTVIDGQRHQDIRVFYRFVGLV